MEGKEDVPSTEEISPEQMASSSALSIQSRTTLAPDMSQTSLTEGALDKASSPLSLKPSSSKRAFQKSPKNLASVSRSSVISLDRRSKPSEMKLKIAGKKKKKKQKSAGESKGTDVVQTGSDLGLPEGVVPIFLAVTTQELFGLRTDEDVTGENPFKYIKKDDIVEDLINRAAICDFHPIKQLMLDYIGEEILVVYDPEFKHGQNFYVATTEEAKEQLLREAAEEDVEEEEEGPLVYVPPISKPWVSFGSEKEVEAESVAEDKKGISVLVVRPRREFGAPTRFSDRNSTDGKHGYVDCAPYEDPTFDLKKMLQDKGIQSVPMWGTSAAQTDFRCPRNAAVQTEAREFTDEQIEKEIDSSSLTEFLRSVGPSMQVTLQQNEIMNVFYDDWVSLTAEDGSFGSKTDNHLKEFQSFTDLQFSKARTITCIDWHPNLKTVIAVSVGERMSFNDRVDNMHKKILTPSLILIWSFLDPIHPQILLEAPDDILCFKFCPTEPNYIAGGCISGQVVLWDISEHSGRLRQAQPTKTKDPLNALAGIQNENPLSTPIVRYCAVSSIEHSHRFPITDLQWVPNHFEVNRMGVPQYNSSAECCQIITCAADQVVLLWDIRKHKATAVTTDDKGQGGIPTTFKHLDLVWKPLLKVHLMRPEAARDHTPTKFSIAERHGDQSSLLSDDNYTVSEMNLASPSSRMFAFGGPSRSGAALAKKTLTSIKTMIYVGTEDGEIVCVDWMPQKDQETGKLITTKPAFYHSIHDGPIVALERSPFFKDLILCVGGWTFSLWKESVTTSPILCSPAFPKRLTGAYWSPSRPAVFYITKQDGSIDIWDLLDRTHEPCMNQSISSFPITCIYPRQVTSKQHLLAVGDTVGTLHILAIPWGLRQPTANELTGMTNYIDREVKRRAFVMSRWDFREKEKVELDNEAKRKAGIAPQVVLTDEEVEYRLKVEYNAYLEEETAFMRQLGLLDEFAKVPVEAK